MKDTGAAHDSYKWDLAGASQIPLNFGDMDWPLDPTILRGLRERLAEPLTYPSPRIVQETAETISAFYRSEYDLLVDPRRIWLGPSCLSQSYQLFDWLLDPRDEVLVFVPAFFHVPAAVTSAGGHFVPIHLVADHAMIDELEAKVSSRTRAIYIVNPHNPTGKVLSQHALTAIVEVARKHGLMIVSNELHCRIIYEGKHWPLQGLSGEVPCFTLGGASKSHNLAGLGGSFVIANAAADLESLRSRTEHRYPPASTLQMLALREAYDPHNPWLDETLAWLRQQRDALCDVLCEIGCKDVKRAEATQFQWVDFTGLLGSYASATEMLRDNCGILSGDGVRFFGTAHHARLSFAMPDAVMEDAHARLLTGGRRLR